MSIETTTGEVNQPEADESTQSRWTVSRVATIATAVLVLLIVALFLIGLAIALLGDVVYWAAMIQIARDIVLFIIAIQGILIIGGISILIVQIARLVNLIQAESVPIIESTQETLKETRATAQFVSKHSTGPLIALQSAIAGLLAFLGEILKINQLIKPNKTTSSQTEDPTT